LKPRRPLGDNHRMRGGEIGGKRFTSVGHKRSESQ
jgi:hypothetical protein